MAVEFQIAITNILARFKFGGPAQDRHTYTCEEENLVDFNLAVGRPTAKPPNLNHCQIFRLYGRSSLDWVGMQFDFLFGALLGPSYNVLK